LPFFSARRTERRRELAEGDGGGRVEADEEKSPFDAFPFGASPVEVDASGLKTYELAVRCNKGRGRVGREPNEDDEEDKASASVVPQRKRTREVYGPAVNA
jgi:hypothetical protein